MFAIAVVVGSWSFLGPTIQSAAVQPNPESCVVTLNGSEFANELPVHEVWEQIFQRYNADIARPGEPPLGDTVRRRLRENSSGALNRVAALRRTLAEQPSSGVKVQDGRDRDMLVAETLIDARDEAERGLTAKEFAELDAQVVAVSQSMTKQMPLPGRVLPKGELPALCELRVDGKEYPYLIPEYKLWEQFFFLYAHAGGLNRSNDGEVTNSYVEILRRETFRMPAADVRVFLDLSAAAATDLARLKDTSPRRTAEEVRAYDRELQREVMAARHRLLLRLSRQGWREVLKELDRSRAGATWWYRSPHVG